MKHKNSLTKEEFIEKLTEMFSICVEHMTATELTNTLKLCVNSEMYEYAAIVRDRLVIKEFENYTDPSANSL